MRGGRGAGLAATFEGDERSGQWERRQPSAPERERRGRPRAVDVDLVFEGLEGLEGGGQGGALGATAVADGFEAAGERGELVACLHGRGAPALARALARGRGGRCGPGRHGRRGGRRRGGCGGRRAGRLHDLDLSGAAEHHLGSTLEALDAARRAHAPPLVEPLRLARRGLQERQQDDDAKRTRIVAGELQDPGVPDRAGRSDLALHGHHLPDVAARLLPRDDERRGGACGRGRERDEGDEREGALHGRRSSAWLPPWKPSVRVGPCRRGRRPRRRRPRRAPAREPRSR